MTNAETTDPSSFTALEHRGSLSALGAEACDVSSADKSPTKTDPSGVALTCRGLNAQTAGLVKVDMADGSTGITLYVTQGNNALAVTKVYTSGTDSGVKAGLAFLY